MKQQANKIRVALLFGSCSSEHEVSCVSAAAWADALATMPDRYEVILVGITKQGRWLKYSGSTEGMRSGSWEQDASCVPCVLSPDRSDHGLLVHSANGYELLPVDVVAPILHGKNGEDGAVQGLLQLAGIPFVGCDMISSACCMDKVITNTLLDEAGIAQAKWLGLKEHEYKENGEEFIKKAEEYLGYPIFVKPANAGSSVGVSKAADKDSLKRAIAKAFKEDTKLVLEEGITGKEIECAVLGNEEPIASLVGEIESCNDFYDYDAKYINEASKLYIPARIEQKISDEIRETAVRAYKALGCSGLARVDFFVREGDNKVLLNEPNTIPGFTSISMYPKMFQKSGVEYPELIDRLFTLACER